ncbi:MAG: beta-phosphoglucomutase [Bacillota bacterium]
MSEDVKAFIFDLDGVITDTAEFHYKSWKKLADEEGIPFDKETNEKLRGVSRRKSLEIILAGRDVSEDGIEEMMARKNGYYQEYINTISSDDLLPGIEEILNKLQEKGYKLAVASASKNAKPVIENLKITDLFETISDGYSVKKTKPAPDLFLHTADKMGVEPVYCVVVEDAEAGIEAAIAANMTSVGIGPRERVGKADYRYEQVKDIDLDEIIEG